MRLQGALINQRCLSLLGSNLASEAKPWPTAETASASLELGTDLGMMRQVPSASLVNDSGCTSTSPGAAANQCGTGITSGYTLNFNVVAAGGSPSLVQIINAEATSWRNLGMGITVNAPSTAWHFRL